MTAKPTWGFRIRLELPEGLRIGSPDKVLTFHDEQVGDFELRAAQVESLKDAETLTLRAEGFASSEVAEQAAVRCRGLVEKAFALSNIGADFGDRAAHGHLTTTGREMLGHGEDVQVLDDVHGVQVFEADPPPRFAGFHIGGIQVGRNVEQFKAAVLRVIEAEAVMSGPERLSYDLFSASHSLSNPDARFVMLMMAVETLIDPQLRTADVRAHVDHLTKATTESDLPKNEKASIKGTLEWLQRESIGQAGSRLAESLEDKEYLGEAPGEFFRRCYDLRSALVHGADPRPSWATVNARVGALEEFVKDLLTRDP